MINEDIITELMTTIQDFSMLMEDMVNDAKSGSFKVDKFTNRIENLCTDSIRNVRGF